MGTQTKWEALIWWALERMERKEWHLSHAVLFKFVEWVLTPKESGAHLGFKNWLSWATREEREWVRSKLRMRG